MKKVIYTIGHSNVTHEEFMELIKKNNIDCVVDVRSVPYSGSQYANQFNKDAIRHLLLSNNIQYVFMGKELGARREDKDLYDENGKLDFLKTMESPLFLEGISRVIKGIEKGYSLAIMCSEKNPLECHRLSMVSRKFHDLGFAIEHILHDGTKKSQEELEDDLINKYFPNRKQIAMEFANDGHTENKETLIDDAYKKHNLEVAYSIEEIGGKK